MVPVRRAIGCLHLQDHRGPDNQAVYRWSPGNGHILDCSSERGIGELAQDARCHVVLGNNRLAIMDPDPRANQPMMSADGRHVLVFNGCIFNFKEIRERLQGNGTVFDTTGDTEVLLQTLIHGDGNATRELNGAWAFGFLDTARQVLHLSRDRYGERNLFYYLDEDNFIAASEVSTIFAALGDRTRRLDPAAVAAFIHFGEATHPTDRGATLFSEIRQVPPGTSIFFDLKTHRADHRRNNLIESYLGPVDSNPDVVAADLERAVSMRLRADVPIAILLSGGIDSSSVAAWAAKSAPDRTNITFYTVKQSKDVEYARIAATDLGVNLVEIDTTSADDAADHLAKVTARFGFPISLAGGGAGTGLGMNVLYQRISEDGIKVVLDGTGGDEVFGGYFGEYPVAAIQELLSERKFVEAVKFWRAGRERNWFEASVVKFRLYGLVRRHHFSSSLLRHFGRFIRPRFHAPTEASASYYRRLMRYRCGLKDTQLDDQKNGAIAQHVFNADSNAAMYAMESRSPFLDMNMIKYSQLAVQSKYQSPYSKAALRAAMPSELSDTIRWRRDKVGAHWISEEFFERKKHLMIEMILQTPLLDELFDLKGFVDELARHPYGATLIPNVFSIAVLCRLFPCDLSTALAADSSAA